MTNSDHARLAMLSIPERWRDLYFDIFYALCVVGQTFVIYYGVSRPSPDADALDILAVTLLRLAAVPIVAALQAYIIMRARDFIMKTWETFKLERYNKGKEDGREEGLAEGLAEGREEGREEERARVIREIRERLARREASERDERDDWLDEILSELSENGGGERRRPRS